MKGRRQILALLGASLTLLGCREAPRPAAPEPHEALIRKVEFAGCAEVRRGPACELEGATDLVLWVDAEPDADLEAQNQIANIAYEAMVLTPDEVVVLYETNGEVNPDPRALVFTRDLVPRPAIHVAPIEYRVTDATTLDDRDRFWVINYHWPGAPWHTGACEITERYGQGASHARCRTVER
ncbi:MAG: hypothetical protein KC933_42015, partial [Myxococcales bacterium]|nr:hypothetical protein [Myxococcales bacterium]